MCGVGWIQIPCLYRSVDEMIVPVRYIEREIILVEVIHQSRHGE